ncbi:reverse transcriptase-rnase h-integrase [Moniliophthora roreri MCA 2997]|uniref:Reverse transcriptase-rnase h-integrase n=1 Tax=Moniliophthora roreri (strain MCA 2997) TaxID=1381753 RepID=V2XUW8_MONRO|nr:reverse transcriptase-rnase h-integrase [Moniliophthora roreri MCA 2997]
MTRLTKKLSEKYLDLYTIIAQPSSNAFTIRLPDYLSGIHPIFHISQLEPFHFSEIPNCTEPPSPLVKIDDEGEPHYEIFKILDSKLDQWCKCQLQYLMKWAGYEGMDKEIQWVSAEDLDLGEALDDFHSNPSTCHKPGPLDKHKAALAQYSALWPIEP